MGTIRFFSGGRDLSDKGSVAHEIIKIELQKGGRMEPAERFKLIMKRKLDASKKKVLIDGNKRAMSKKAQDALQQIAQKKAVKEAKRIRQMVIVQPKIYNNGRLTKQGAIYDIAGNKIGQVNKKNGKMATVMGTALGKYKPKSRYVDGIIVDNINKWSPYYINLRKMQAMQAAGLDPVTGLPINQGNGADVINVHGPTSAQAAMLGGGYQSMSDYIHQHHSHNSSSSSNGPVSDNPFEYYGQAPTGPRQNVGVTAWGAASDNVWGTFADNAWGVSTDNVWGGNSSDIWGGVGGNPYGAGAKSVQFWGTGSGNNILLKMAKRAAAFFGLHLRLGTGKPGAAQGRTGRSARGVTSSGPTARSARSAPTRSGSSGGARATTRAPSAPVGRR